MVKEKEIINLLTAKNLLGTKSLSITSSVIDTIDLIGAFELETHLIIENCIIQNLNIHSCWFMNGLILKNCIITNYIDYQMGGHNVEKIILEGNLFKEFFNFFDCHFDEVLEVRNNIFLKGSNLLANRNEGYDNTFNKGYSDFNNLGIINLDREIS